MTGDGHEKHAIAKSPVLLYGRSGAAGRGRGMRGRARCTVPAGRGPYRPHLEAVRRGA